MSAFLNRPFGEIKARLHDNPIRDAVEIYLSVEDKDGVYIGKSIEYERLEDDHRLMEPTESFKPSEAQQLFNELWRIGYRPSKGYQEGMEATQKHLNDMRKIVSKNLGVEF